LRYTHRLAFLALGVLIALAAFSQAGAVTATKTYQVANIQFLVTPSPAPSSGFVPSLAAARQVAALASAQRGADPAMSALVSDPFAGPFQLASAGTAWDVAPGIMIAQVQVQPSPVPVQFVTKANPNAAYLDVTVVSPSLNAAYGSNFYPCVLTIKTYYTTAYALNDWGYGTSSSGGLATYPIENYPTTSYLSYAVKASPEPSPEPTSASYTAFYNEGTPGQNVWTKTAGTTYTGCFDFSLTVPTSLAPGTYTASIQFNLNVAE
jgi:hypothetical protein